MSEKLESIHKQFDKMDLIGRFAWFTLYTLDDWRLWVEKDGGEGFEIRKSEFLNLCDEWFNSRM